MKRIFRPPLLVAAMLCHVPATVACEYHGALGHGFNPFGLFGRMPEPNFTSRPQTPEDAARVTAAKPAQPAAAAEDAKVLDRIGPQLRTLYYMLDGLAMAGKQPSVSVWTKESGQWIRFAREGKVMRVSIDTTGPAAGDLIIRTSAAKLGEVFDRRVKLPAVVGSGEVVIEADSQEADTVRRFLMISYS